MRPLNRLEPLEWLVVVAIVGIIAAIAIPAYLSTFAGSSNIVCYSGGTQIFKAEDVRVVRGDRRYYINSPKGQITIEGECVVTPR